MEKELQLPITELRYLTIRCGSCGVTVGLDLAELKGIPAMCPCCQTYYDSQLTSDVSALSRVHRNAGAVNYKLSFRIPAPQD
jgi:hypothetical protein